jgi:hypothetical protein
MRSDDHDETTIPLSIPNETMQQHKENARQIESWEKTFFDAGHCGLLDLFGTKKKKNNQKGSSSSGNQGDPQQTSCSNNSNLNNHGSKKGNSFIFRMEHREGGVMAQHYGEERLCVFRSDQPGVIAKVIYSSTPAIEETSPDDGNISSTSAEAEDEESMLSKMAQAKVHVIWVKEGYRGFDLGGLLFHEAMMSLKQRYNNSDYSDTNNDNDTSSSTNDETVDSAQTKIHQHHHETTHPLHLSVRCQLDAEEDIRRHNKLVDFYEQLGCKVKPKAKIKYLNNNDGETYRKVPMQIVLRPKTKSSKTTSTFEETSKKPSDAAFSSSSLAGRQGGFLPILVWEAPGKRVGLSSVASEHHRSNGSSRDNWLLLETPEGSLEFHTTKGFILRVAPDGQCTAEADDTSDEETTNTYNDFSNRDWSKFQLLRVAVSQQRNNDGDSDCEASLVSSEEESWGKELWVLRSTHGTFLTIDPRTHSLRCSKEVAFWQADEHSFSITMTSGDTPRRRQHYRKMWLSQTVQYVHAMHERYCSFNLQKMTLKRALNHWAKGIPGNPFAIDGTALNPSLRTLCVSLILSPMRLRYGLGPQACEEFVRTQFLTDESHTHVSSLYR